MSDTRVDEPPVAVLRLVSVRGPSIPAREITKRGAVIGRSSACEVRLADATVSRRHAEIRHVGGRWMLGDLGGANGTWLNEVRLEPRAAVPLVPGDRLSIGPWVLRVGAWTPTTVAMTESIDGKEIEDQIQRIDPATSGRLAHHRLGVLIACAGRINAAENERALGAALTESIVEGTGYGRASMVRMVGDDEGVEVLGASSGDGAHSDTFSRSLVVRASSGEVVTMTARDDSAGWGQSIAELEIHSAMCCPILVDEQVTACLYLDARGGEAQVEPDAVGFCQALSQLAGLAMANLNRRSMAERQRELDKELDAARQAQRLMVPLKRTSLGRVEYEVEFHPGRVASGDLFDVLALPEDRVAVLLGDVSGKGVGAALLMAAAQSYLNAALCRHACPGQAVQDLHHFILDRSASNRFLSLWVGVFGPSGVLTYVDAGHGHWAMCGRQGIMIPERSIGSLVGAFEEAEFPTRSIEVTPEDRVVLMTDGVPEQQDAEGVQFGTQRIEEVLQRTRTCREDVVELLAATRSWAGGAPLSDDTTVASARFLGPA